MDQVLFLTAYPNQNEAGTGLSPGKTDTHIKEDAIGKVLPEKVTRLHAEMADKDDINESELAEGVKGIPVSPINIEFEKFDKEHLNNNLTQICDCEVSPIAKSANSVSNKSTEYEGENTVQCKIISGSIGGGMADTSAEIDAGANEGIKADYYSDTVTKNNRDQPDHGEFLKITSYCCRSCEADIPLDEIAFRRHHQNCPKWLSQMSKTPKGDIRRELFKAKKNIFSCHLCAFKHSGSGKFNGCFSSKYDQSRHEWKKHRHCKIDGRIYVIPQEMYDIIHKSTHPDSNDELKNNSNLDHNKGRDNRSVAKVIETGVKFQDAGKNVPILSPAISQLDDIRGAVSRAADQINHEYDGDMVCMTCHNKKDNFHNSLRMDCDQDITDTTTNQTDSNNSDGSVIKSPLSSSKLHNKKKLRKMRYVHPYDSELVSIVTDQMYPYYKKRPFKRFCNFHGMINRNPLRKNDSIDDIISDCKKISSKVDKSYPCQHEYVDFEDLSDRTSALQYNPLVKQVLSMNDDGELLDYLADIDTMVMQSLKSGLVNKALFPLASSVVQKFVISWCRDAKSTRPEMKPLYAELSKILYKRDALLLKYVNLNFDPATSQFEHAQYTSPHTLHSHHYKTPTTTNHNTYLDKYRRRSGYKYYHNISPSPLGRPFKRI